MNATSGVVFPQSDYGSINTCEFVSDSSCGVLNIETGQIDDNPGTWTVVQAPLATLAAASLATSRSVQAPTPATAFGTIINSGTADASGCGIAPGTPVVAATFSYQTTDPATNAPTGTPDTPADIAAGESQSYVFSFTPTADIPSTDEALAFDCTDTDPAAVIPGVNTFTVGIDESGIRHRGLGSHPVRRRHC